jgi:hypothetical protein
LFLLANLLLTSARSACLKLKAPVAQFANPVRQGEGSGMLLDGEPHANSCSAIFQRLSLAARGDTQITKR